MRHKGFSEGEMRKPFNDGYRKFVDVAIRERARSSIRGGCVLKQRGTDGVERGEVRVWWWYAWF